MAWHDRQSAEFSMVMQEIKNGCRAIPAQG